MSPYLVIGGTETGSGAGKRDQSGTSSDSGFEEESESEQVFYQQSKAQTTHANQKKLDIQSKTL